MKIKMQWVVNPRRKKRETGAISPVKPSKYFEELAKNATGWKND